MYVDKERRRIYYAGDIDDKLAEEFIYHFLELDQHSGEITIVSSSFGGDYDTACIPMMDVILSSKNHVVSYGYGAQASCQSFLFLAADERYLSSERSYLLLHAGSSTINSEGEVDLRDYERLTDELKKTANVIVYQMNQDMEYFSSRSNKPPSYFKEEIAKGDFFIFPEKAMELDLIHGIKGINGTLEMLKRE